MSRTIASARIALLSSLIAVTPTRGQTGPYDPQVGSGAQDAIPKTSSAFQEWAPSVVLINRGPQDIAVPGSPLFGADPVTGSKLR
jgi:hypothetical protein